MLGVKSPFRGDKSSVAERGSVRSENVVSGDSREGMLKKVPRATNRHRRRIVQGESRKRVPRSKRGRASGNITLKKRWSGWPRALM